jgi:prepilin-type N-terminal cleavage/methylation domain-containing protein
MSKRTHFSRQQGFTFMELFVTLILVGILAAFAVPAFREMASGGQMRSASADLVTAINTARVQAVNLRVPITVAATDGSDWDNGWTIQYPAGVISESDQAFVPGGNITLDVGSVTSFRFLASGILDAASSVEFELCDSKLSGETGRKITVSRFGKITNEHVGC